MHLAKWVPMDNIYPEAVADEFEWALWYAVWKARKALNLPHTMIANMYRREADDKLLTHKVLIFLAVMITRLGGNDFARHTVVPIMAITVFAGYKLRILQAHYCLEGLVIRKSHLLSFTDKDVALPNMDIVMRFMAAKMVGNTKNLHVM
ncbi:hypothetical protein BO94DRAFT_601882, partial [Aspergillus sclerotioniger CBS 115572]